MVDALFYFCSPHIIACRQKKKTKCDETEKKRIDIKKIERNKWEEIVIHSFFQDLFMNETWWKNDQLRSICCDGWERKMATKILCVLISRAKRLRNLFWTNKKSTFSQFSHSYLSSFFLFVRILFRLHTVRSKWFIHY